jgi:hypothetical protein
LLLLGAVAASSRADWFNRLLVFVWGFASLRSARHVPLFALVAAPVLAQAVAERWRRASESGGPRSTIAVLRSFCNQYGQAPRASVWAFVAVVAVFVTVPAITFPDARFPVVAVERNLACLADGSAPHILTSDQWADYVIYRLYPRQRVFFDGRSDFFGDRIGGEYRTLLAAEQGWRELLDRRRFQLALLPHDWPLSTMLDSEPGWRRIYADRVAVLYERKEAM